MDMDMSIPAKIRRSIEEKRNPVYLPAAGCLQAFGAGIEGRACRHHIVQQNSDLRYCYALPCPYTALQVQGPFRAVQMLLLDAAGTDQTGTHRYSEIPVKTSREFVNLVPAFLPDLARSRRNGYEAAGNTGMSFEKLSQRSCEATGKGQ